MGANCCVAVKEKPLPCHARFEVSTHRNIRYSPSWSLRWDSRTHIEDIIDNHAQFSHNSENFGSEIKSWAESENGGLSGGGSPMDASRMLSWQKSVIRTGTSGHFKIGASDHVIEGNSSPEGKSSIKSSGLGSVSDIKPSLSIPSTPSSSLMRADPSSSRSCSLHYTPTSRKAHDPPGHPFPMQVSDITTPVLKSLTENCSPEDRQSFVLSVCSNDLSTGGSQCGSSDGWSMRTFSELVASSQKERWSFDSGSPNFINHKAISNRKQSTSRSSELQTCGICLKQIKDRSPLISASNEVAVVAVLVCEHVYHAECLDIVTPEIDRYDPSCPICMYGEKYGSKLLAKVELTARNRISRIAVANADIGSDPISEGLKRLKNSRLGASSSMKSSFTWPFLSSFNWHFSIGSRPPAQPVSKSESSRRKGFWARYRRE